MKKIMIIVILIQFSFAKGQPSSQASAPNSNRAATNMALFDMQNAEAQALGMITSNSDTSKSYSNGTRNRMELGATLLHNNWENSGIVYTSDKEFSFNSMDFDLSTGALLIKMDDDIFTFTTQKIKKIIMNGVVYKILYNPESGKYEFFEIVHNANDLEILKGYKLIYKAASPHAMFNTGQKNSLRRQEIFYLNSAFGPKQIKISKKKIMKIIDNKDFNRLKNGLMKSKNSRNSFR